jgi:hypothetical protein
MGKYRMPIVGKVFGLRLPKGTLATTTAGYGANAIDHDKEFYRGSDLYTAYKTRQVFTLEQDLINGVFVDMRAPYTLLSSWHLKGRYLLQQTLQPSQDLRHLTGKLINAFGWWFIRPLVLLVLLPFYTSQVLQIFCSMGEEKEQESSA